MSKSLVRIKLVFRIAARRSMEMISASCSSGRGGELTAPVGAPKPASAGLAVEPSATTETTSEAAAAAAPRDVEAFRAFSFSSRREPASRVDTPAGSRAIASRAGASTWSQRVDADVGDFAQTKASPGASGCADISRAGRRGKPLSTPAASRTTRRARSRARALASVVLSDEAWGIIA